MNQMAGIDGLHPRRPALHLVNLAIGMITPPVGVNLFVASRVSGLTLETVVRGTITPLIVMIAVLLVITYVPALSLALPAFFGM